MTIQGSLPHLPQEIIRLGNLIADYGGAYTCQDTPLLPSIRLTPVFTLSDDYQHAEIRFSDGTLVISFQETLTEVISDKLWAGWETQKALLTEWRIKYALSALLNALSPCLGLPETIQYGKPVTLDPARRFYAAVQIDQKAWKVCIQISQNAANKINKILSKHISSLQRTPVNNLVQQDILSCPAYLLVGKAFLTPGNLRSVKPGDGILLEQTGQPLNSCRLLVRGYGYIQGLMEGYHFTSQAIQRSCMMEDEQSQGKVPAPKKAGESAAAEKMEDDIIEEDQADEVPQPMAREDEPGQAADTDANESIEDVELELRFVIATKKISIKELASLGTGATLTLNKSLDDQISIWINDARIGRGFLYQIGDQLGVRIDTWQDHRTSHE